MDFSHTRKSNVFGASYFFAEEFDKYLGFSSAKAEKQGYFQALQKTLQKSVYAYCTRLHDGGYRYMGGGNPASKCDLCTCTLMYTYALISDSVCDVKSCTNLNRCDEITGVCEPAAENKGESHRG